MVQGAARNAALEPDIEHRKNNNCEAYGTFDARQTRNQVHGTCDQVFEVPLVENVQVQWMYNVL